MAGMVRAALASQSGVTMWTIHRALTDRINLHRPFLANSLPRVLALSVKDEISHAQLFPYFDNADKLNIQIRELPIKSFLSGKAAYRGHVDSIYLQTWFDFTDERMNALLDAIEGAWPGAPITYFDWFAPTDLRYAKVLAPRIKPTSRRQILSGLQPIRAADPRRHQFDELLRTSLQSFDG